MRPPPTLHPAMHALWKELWPEQQRAFEAAHWLFSEENRREGRSTLMAFVFLNILLRLRAEPEGFTSVRVTDHYLGGRGFTSKNPGLSDAIMGLARRVMLGGSKLLFGQRLRFIEKPGQETVEFLRTPCRSCGKDIVDHEDGKCLFGPGTFSWVPTVEKRS